MPFTPHSPMRRALLGAAAAALAGARPVAALAASTYPDKPVRLIVQVQAGTAADTMMRAMAEHVSQQWGQPIVMENRIGVAGTLGPATVAKSSRPDGYTLTVIPISLFRLPFMQEVNFDPRADFTYIANLSAYTFGTVVGADSKYRDFKSLIEDARARPGEISYATPGIGSTQHLTMEQISLHAGVRFNHVPFKGTPEAIAALLGGHVDVVADASAWTPAVESGKARLLCTWGLTRPKRWKDQPTLTELGIPVVADSPCGIGGPHGMAPEVVKRINDAFRDALDAPRVVQTLDNLQMVPRYMDTADYNRFINTEIEASGKLIERLGLAKKA